MKLFFENWRKFMNEDIFYVSATQLLPSEELGHGKNDEGYDTEQAVAEKMQQIQRGKLEPIEVCNQKPVNPYRLADKSMEKSGQAEPFYYVLDGHHRLEAISRLGVERVPVYLTNKEINEAMSEDVDPKMKKYLKKHPYMEPDQLQGEAVEDVYTGNCGMFGIALAEEAQRRGADASLVFAHNADTDQEIAYGDYKLYHVALKIGDKYYDGRGEIQLKELVSFMWEKPEDMNVDAFNLKNLELMKDAIRRNTAWTQTCEYYREQASEFLDEMGYETDEVLSEGKKIKIFRAQPAFTKVIRTNDYITMSRKFAGDHAVTSAVYNDEPFYVVYAFVDENDIKEADNPGEYLYVGEPFEAKPSQMATPEGDLSFIRGRFNEAEDFQTRMKKSLPAELDFLLNKGPHNKKEGPGVKNPKKPKFKSAPPGTAPVGEAAGDCQVITVLRLGSEDGLANRNAANAEGLQEYLERTGDYSKPQFGSGEASDRNVYIYKVEVCGGFGDYKAVSGGATDAAEEAETPVGIKEFYGGDFQWFYFPQESEGTSWRIVEKVGAINNFGSDPVWKMYGSGEIKINGKHVAELVKYPPKKHAYTKDERPYQPEEYDELPSVWGGPWEWDAGVIALKHYLDNVYDIKQTGV